MFLPILNCENFLLKNFLTLFSRILASDSIIIPLRGEEKAVKIGGEKYAFTRYFGYD